jgi:hypothetical protein
MDEVVRQFTMLLFITASALIAAATLPVGWAAIALWRALQKWTARSQSD